MGGGLLADVLLVASALSYSDGAEQPDALMNDTAKFWEGFRDPSTGLYCDHFSFDPVSVPAVEIAKSAAHRSALCQGVQYSSAATGMGLIATAVFAEIGLLTRVEALRRAAQTLESLATKWPVILGCHYPFVR
jgi:Zn-dependent M28 family amino/carboxypeptidase